MPDGRQSDETGSGALYLWHVVYALLSVGLGFLHGAFLAWVFEPFPTLAVYSIYYAVTGWATVAGITTRRLVPVAVRWFTDDGKNNDRS